jgi:hypothetical protein
MEDDDEMERLVERLTRVDIAPSSLVANRRTEASLRRRALPNLRLFPSHAGLCRTCPYSSI